MARNQKIDEDQDDSIYAAIDKSSVLLQSRCFHSTPIDPIKSRIILAKVVCLLRRGSSYSVNEATDVFIATSKLFQNQDSALRQFIYLVIKELAPFAEHALLVMASIQKDISSNSGLIYKPNAIRALCRLTPNSMVSSIDRQISQSIVSTNHAIASAAIVSAIHMFPLNDTIVTRWGNALKLASTNLGPFTQYHALGLMFLTRQHDKGAIARMVQDVIAQPPRSPHAICIHIRHVWKVVQDRGDQFRAAAYVSLSSWLRHKSDMVVFEAARAICNLDNVSKAELDPAISALQLMIANHKPTLRFAAIRTLYKLAMTFPEAVFPCNLDMENLITDSNRSIATFAITTLLKTGNEASVDRLMKQITGFMSEISDEFKVIVVDTVRSLCLKFPTKQTLVLKFLAGSLRDDGGYEFKRTIVDAIFDIIHAIPESLEFALSHLCDFIEDCEYSKLAVRILSVLGSEGPRATNPTKYIRYIYNLVILENSVVRAAAVSALAQFAVHLVDARSRIMVLLGRCTDDSDDEVRDRAALYLSILNNGTMAEKYIGNDATFVISTLEANLEYYLKDPTRYGKPFDVGNVPVVSRHEETAERQRAAAAARELAAVGATATSGTTAQPSTATSISAAAAAAASHHDAQSIYSKSMERIPELAALGPLFRSSLPVELTEPETEYIVTCIKHVFSNHFVFQFECKNTLKDSMLENVTVSMINQDTVTDPTSALLKPEYVIPAAKLEFDVPASTYVVYKRDAGITPTTYFSNTLHFIAKDCDPSTGEPDPEGFKDVYQVEDIEIHPGDYMMPTYVSDFQTQWAEMGADAQAIETYALTDATSIKEAVSRLVGVVGMQALDGTGNPKENASTHVMALSGSWCTGGSVLSQVRMVYEPSSGVSVEICVRSARMDVSERIANALG